MRIYIAGKLSTSSERESLNEIATLCENLGFETFLPHREVGLFYEIKNAEVIFHKDIFGGLRKCDVVVALLEGLHVGAGTAWELGFAYAQGIQCIGLKTDESLEEAADYLSPILLSSVDIVNTKEALRDRLNSFKNARIED
ncbi:MAG: nucleoside 2-deoxyribosyltransferase [Nanoarchaeota archaeon]